MRSLTTTAPWKTVAEQLVAADASRAFSVTRFATGMDLSFEHSTINPLLLIVIRKPAKQLPSSVLGAGELDRSAAYKLR